MTTYKILSIFDLQNLLHLQASSTVTRAIEFYGPDRGTFLVMIALIRRDFLGHTCDLRGTDVLLL
jgi:hypothetical protein